MKHGKLVLVRHGESKLNELNLFTGWLDVPLTEAGIKEAQQATDHCRRFDYDAAFTSHLERAHETLLIILSGQKRIGVFQHESDKRYAITKDMPAAFRKKILPIYSARDLNERSYGSLQGMNKNTASKWYGKKQVFSWRRGFYSRPPHGESLEDVYKRAIPYFEKEIHSRVKRGETVLMAGHGNTLRAVIKFLEKIGDDNIPLIDLPFGHPLVYKCENGVFTRTEGSYNYHRSLR